MMRLSLPLLAVLGLLAMPAQADPADGRAMAERWCAGCHVVAPEGPGTDAAPPFAAIAARSETSRVGLKAFLIRPHGEMPDFALSRPYIDAIIDYILSLRHEDG